MSSQLIMTWPQERIAAPPACEIPKGYRIRTFQQGDEETYMDLMRAAGFDWTREILDDVVENAVPGGILFAIHSATGIIVATAMGWAKPHEKFPDAHEMGWVAARQEHSGRGLGRLVTAASTAAIIRDGARGIYLLTDDCRLPAIKSYLQVGYLPYYSEEDHACRWQRVFEQLGLRTEDYPATEGRERS